MKGRFFGFLGLVCLTALCVLGCGCQEEQADAAAVAQPVPVTASPAVIDTAAVGPTVIDEAGAAAPDVPDEPDVPDAENEPAGGYAGPELAECEAVDDEFFADAAFFGNSLVDGLRRHGGLSQGSFFAVTSASVVNVGVTLNCILENGSKGTLIAALTQRQYAKIYILLGINEIGFEPDYFAELYGAMLDRIRGGEPDADIYIMSLTPVTQECSDGSEFFNMERIELYNEALLALARDRQCYFVDLCQALADEDGFLPAEDSTDGIHLKPEKYPQWADYLRTHVKP